jgi:hypothetical protein
MFRNNGKRSSLCSLTLQEKRLLANEVIQPRLNCPSTSNDMPSFVANKVVAITGCTNGMWLSSSSVLVVVIIVVFYII